MIELLVVVAIIAILLSILLPSLRSARETARAAACGQRLRDFSNAFGAYFAENDDWIPGINTTGIAVEARRGLYSELNSPRMPVCTYDWITPIMTTQVEMKAGWIDRLEEIIHQFHCPSQKTYTASIYPSPMPIGILNQVKEREWMALSFLMPVHFQYWGMDYGVEGPQKKVVGRHKASGQAIYAATVGEPEDWEAEHRTYRSRLVEVGTASQKVAVADATRYLNREFGALTLDFDPDPFPKHFGSFTTSGAWWSGSTAFGVDAGSRNWNGSIIGRGSPSDGLNLELTYRHGPRRGAGLSGSAQQNKGQVNALHFDGSVRRYGDKESRNPVLWYPRGTVVQPDSASERMIEDLQPGDLVP